MQRFKKKPDRLMNREDIGNVIAEGIYHALRPLDEMVHQMERRWGADRLVGLVSIETAAKYGRAKAKLDRAIDANDVEAVKKNAANMIKAWKVLSDEAVTRGHKGLDPEVWEVMTEDGQRYAFCRSNVEAWKTSKDMEGTRVFSIEEAARLIDVRFKLVGEVKDVFSDAKVVDAREQEPLDDAIPF